MRIGFFSDRYLPLTDGIAYSMEDARRELEKQGHEVYIFAPKPSLRYHEPSSRIIRFPAVKGLFFEDYRSSFFFPPQTSRQIDKLKLDLIHFHTPGQLGLFGAYYALHHDIPLVTTYHTDLYEYVKHYPNVLPGVIALSMLAPVATGGGMDEYRTALSSIKPERSIDKWNQKIVERGMTLVHNHCDLIITPSIKMEKQLKSWKTKARIVTLPSGVDEITTNEEKIAETRRKFNITAEDQVVLYVGRIGTEKNLSLLIKAFAHLAPRHPHAKAVFIGPGDDISDFRAEADATGFGDRIIFTGRIERQYLGAFYEIARVFAFPSLGDTQALVINEAAWAGTPIVMVDREISLIVQDGVDGYFARNTARDFASKISLVLNHPEREAAMAKTGRYLASKLTASNQATKLLRLYEETIEQHHGQSSSIQNKS